MGRATVMVLAMSDDRKSKARKVGGRALVRDAGLRPAPHHEAEIGCADPHDPGSQQARISQQSLTLRNARRGVSKGGRPSAAESLSPAALYRLMAWLSPAYPVGAFSYSGGLEWAIEAGDVTDAGSLSDWLDAVLTMGSASADAVLFATAHRAVANSDDDLLRRTAELAAALVGSKERLLETTAQGRAFLDASRNAWPCAAIDRLGALWDGAVAYPVAVAVTAAGHAIPLAPALNAYLAATVANLVSAGVRLIPLGQSDGQRVIAALAPAVASAADKAAATALDGIGTCAVRADLASMRHETQYTRLFRS
jgi:urease accessory protein